MKRGIDSNGLARIASRTAQEGPLPAHLEEDVVFF